MLGQRIPLSISFRQFLPRAHSLPFVLAHPRYLPIPDTRRPLAPLPITRPSPCAPPRHSPIPADPPPVQRASPLADPPPARLVGNTNHAVTAVELDGEVGWGGFCGFVWAGKDLVSARIAVEAAADS